MKKTLLTVMTAVGMVGGARGDILMAFNGASPAAPGQWLYEYEVSLVGGGSLNPDAPWYDVGLFTLFDVEGYVPGSASFSAFGSAEFYLSIGDVDGQSDASDIQGSYPSPVNPSSYIISEGETIGLLTFVSTSEDVVVGQYDSYANQEGDVYEVYGARIQVPGFVPPPVAVPEASTVISAGMLGLLGGGYVLRRRMAAKRQ